MTHSLRRIRQARMTDSEREAEIARLTAEMEAAFNEWKLHGHFPDYVSAHCLMRMRDDLVRGRSAELLGRMKGAQG